MRKTLQSMVGLTLLIGLGTPAMAQERYFNAALGIADVDGFDDGWVLIGGYGIQVPEVDKNFFIEGEITATLDDPERAGADVSYYTLAGYAVYALPVTQTVDLRGRAGLLYYDADVSGTAGPFSFREDEDGIELSFGIGARFEVNNELDVIVDYTQIESDIDHLSAGIQYHF